MEREGSVAGVTKAAEIGGCRGRSGRRQRGLGERD